MTHDMDKTPIRRNLRRNHASDDVSNVELKQSKCSTSTPFTYNGCDSDDSFSCTQGNDDIEVVWDWNSPQTKLKPIKRDKRHYREDHKFVIPQKKPMLSNQLEFEKLKRELQALKDEISQNFEELPLSPQEERHFKDIGNNIYNVSSLELFNDDLELADNPVDCVNKTQIDKNKIEDLMNDSEDEQLLMCTQVIEEKLEKVTKSEANNKPELISNQSKVAKPLNKFYDDSFDSVLKEFQDADIKILTQSCDKTFTSKLTSNTNFKRTFSDIDYSFKNQKDQEKFQFHRTLSFETAVRPKQDITKAVLEEIERKKNEALAKRMAKTKQNCDNTNVVLPKCSPEEIEEKRRQALAKLEAKKQIDIAEKNRLEALKKLEAKKLQKLGGIKKN